MPAEFGGEAGQKLSQQRGIKIDLELILETPTTSSPATSTELGRDLSRRYLDKRLQAEPSDRRSLAPLSAEPVAHEPACAPSSLRTAGRARLRPSGTDLEALDALAAARPVDRLRRLRLHRRQPARRQPRQHHAAALAAAHRPPADRAGRRRHHQGRRPVGQGREPAAARRGDASRANIARHPTLARKLPELRRRPGQALLVNNAEWLDRARATSRSCATIGTPLHGQPHADLRFGASCGSSASSR